MKKHKTTFIMVLFFFIGLLGILYPSISNFYNQKHQTKAIVNYEELLEQYDKKDYIENLNDAHEYNKKLAKLKQPLLTYNTIKNYKKILNTNNDGMIGYISIDKIKIELPIYHGTSKKVLSFAVGHLEGTSFPVGGEKTHSVLSAHRGLPSSKLFTDLNKLEKGDTFTIKVLDQLLTYQVDQITVVKPTELNKLKIEPKKDYVTLMTCTPYGINTHRLLVRGIRVENAKEKSYVTTEAYVISNLIVTPLVAQPIIFIILLIIALKPVDNTNEEIITKLDKNEEV